MAATAPAPTAPATPFAVPAWRVGVAARVIDSLAVWALLVALGYVVYDETGSATAVAVLTVAARIPGVVLATHSGALADALDVRRLTRRLALLQAIPAAALAAFAWDGRLEPGVAYAGVFCISLFAAVMGPGMQLEIGSTLPLELRRRGRALSNAFGYAAGVVGAAGGGALVAADGPRFVMVLTALCAVGVAIVFARFPAPDRPRIPHRPVRHTLQRVPTPAWLLVGATLVIAFVLEPLTHLAPVIARRHGDSAGLLGLYVGAIALGAMIGGLTMRACEERALPVRRALPPAMAVAALALIGLAAWPNLALALATMVLAGACWEICALETLFGVLPHAPERRVGLQIGIWSAATAAGAVLGTLVLGWTMDHVGVDISLLVCAGLLLALAIASTLQQWLARAERDLASA
jgi:predicted MFS family arabinose efflux permease